MSIAEQRNLQSLLAQREVESNEFRRLCEFFTRSSERLTSQVKQISEAKREREQKVNVITGQMEDIKSHNMALQLQLKELHVPGRFS